MPWCINYNVVFLCVQTYFTILFYSQKRRLRIWVFNNRSHGSPHIKKYKSEVLPSQQHTRNLLDMPSHDKLMLAHVKFQINSTSQTQGGIMRLSWDQLTVRLWGPCLHNYTFHFKLKPMIDLWPSTSLFFTHTKIILFISLFCALLFCLHVMSTAWGRKEEYWVSEWERDGKSLTVDVNDYFFFHS